VIFTVAFWRTAIEHALVAGAAAFVASPVVTSGSFTVAGLKAAGIAAGLGALYSLVKQVGAAQAVGKIAKVDATAPATMPKQ
jgi:hypothetical protein